jgi:hypothetical protein
MWTLYVPLRMATSCCSRMTGGGDFFHAYRYVCTILLRTSRPGLSVHSSLLLCSQRAGRIALHMCTCIHVKYNTYYTAHPSPGVAIHTRCGGKRESLASLSKRRCSSAKESVGETVGQISALACSYATFFAYIFAYRDAGCEYNSSCTLAVWFNFTPACPL